MGLVGLMLTVLMLGAVLPMVTAFEATASFVVSITGGHDADDFIAPVKVVPIEGRTGFADVDPIDPPGIGGIEAGGSVRIGDVTGRTGQGVGLVGRVGAEGHIGQYRRRVINGHCCTVGVALVGAIVGRHRTGDFIAIDKGTRQGAVLPASVPFTVQAMVLSSLSPSSSTKV